MKAAFLTLLALTTLADPLELPPRDPAKLLDAEVPESDVGDAISSMFNSANIGDKSGQFANFPSKPTFPESIAPTGALLPNPVVPTSVNSPTAVVTKTQTSISKTLPNGSHTETTSQTTASDASSNTSNNQGTTVKTQTSQSSTTRVTHQSSSQSGRGTTSISATLGFNNSPPAPRKKEEKDINIGSTKDKPSKVEPKPISPPEVEEAPEAEPEEAHPNDDWDLVKVAIEDYLGNPSKAGVFAACFEPINDLYYGIVNAKDAIKGRDLVSLVDNAFQVKSSMEPAYECIKSHFPTHDEMRALAESSNPDIQAEIESVWSKIDLVVNSWDSKSRTSSLLSAIPLLISIGHSAEAVKNDQQP